MKLVESINFPISSFKRGCRATLKDGRVFIICEVEYLCGRHYFIAVGEDENKLYPLEWVISLD